MPLRHPRELRDQASEQFAAGATYYRIAKRLGVDKTTIRRWLRGIAPPTAAEPIRTPAAAVDALSRGTLTTEIPNRTRAQRREDFKTHPDATRRTAERLARDGLSTIEIAKHLGVDQRTLNRWAQHASRGGSPARAVGFGLTITTPRGTRIEGLSSEAALELVVMLEVD